MDPLKNTVIEVGKKTTTNNNKMKEALNSCKLVYSYLSDPVLRQKHLCLVTAANAISCKNFGCNKDIVQNYPYADVAGRRYTKPGCSYSCVKDRGVVGSAILNLPPNEEYSNLPLIATLITQYGIGKSIETNEYAKKSVQYSLDIEHVNSLRNDTEEQRLCNFSISLAQLKELLNSSERDYIQYVIFPLGIGRSGNIDEVWLGYYLPSILAFSKEIQGKTVCFAVNEEVFVNLDHKYKETKLGNLLAPLKELEILKDVNNYVEISKDVCGANRSPLDFLYSPSLYPSL